jgi:hypothetical protein
MRSVTGGRSERQLASGLAIVNPDPRYTKVRLIEPSSLGYIHIAAEVSPPRSLLPRGRRRKAGLLAGLRELGRQLEQFDAVVRVTVFDAVAIAPPSLHARRRPSAQVARFDVVVLVEAASLDAAREIQHRPEYRRVIEWLDAESADLHVAVACNAKRIDDVDKSTEGLFLFDYFVADDAVVALELWDYLAGWYWRETGLNNSTLLVPAAEERSYYVAINHARWDFGLLRLLLRQLPKRSFCTYVLANLDANRVGAMPILYRLA